MGQFMLALVLASLLLASTLPPLYRLIARTQYNVQLQIAVDDIFTGMTLALTTHWQATGCRTTPDTLTLANLINDYHAPTRLNDITWLHSPTLSFNADTAAPFTVRSATIKITMTDAISVNAAARYLKGHDYWVTVNDTRLILTLPISPISSVVEQSGFNTQTACME
ncbi:hypothetical protein [Photobacterium indicum]|uniref:hypothetical protein n=1 Tax=Photobacterium indicum TaxID=81447 RepID=UPI003D0BAE91